MKKGIIFVFFFLIIPFNVFAEEKVNVKFDSCIDGDTANFKMNDEKIKVRFLAIDTPETKHPTKGEEPYGKEASNYTCNKLKNAAKIELEFDDNSDKKDKYDRYLAWVYVDSELLQASLVKNGLAEVAYIYGDYKYTQLLKDYEETAKLQKVGMYSDKDTSIYSKNKEKLEGNVLNKKKKEVKNKLMKYINKILDEFLDEIFN